MARINTKQAPDIIPARAIQLRAYDVLSTCSFAGKTVEDLEQCGDNRFEIVSIFTAAVQSLMFTRRQSFAQAMSLSQ